MFPQELPRALLHLTDMCSHRYPTSIVMSGGTREHGSLWEQFSGTMIHVSWLGASIRETAIAGLGKNHPANEKNHFH